ncbi:hypothetical protein GCM10027422_23230 [Hymenobacter arcticus]
MRLFDNTDLKKANAGPKGQLLETVYDMKGLLKYVIKPVANFYDIESKEIDIGAVDTIFRALASHRTFQTYGINAAQSGNRAKTNSAAVNPAG